MKIIAYIYTDPLLEPAIDVETYWEGWEVEQMYHDLGQRTQLQQLLTDCQTKAADYLLVRGLEDLGDNLGQISDRLKVLEAMGISVIATEQPNNTQSLNLLREVQSRRLRQGHARTRLDFAPPPGKVPYGYRRSQGRYSIDRSTSPVVKDFFDHFLLYGSLRGAVRHLAKKYSKKISVTTGRRWLTNPVYRGDTAYLQGEVISNTHAAIISREEAAQVDRILRRNSRLPSRTASAPRSLAGLVVCGQCQLHLTVIRVTQRHQNKEYLYLRVPNCPQRQKCPAIPYGEVLQQTIEKVCRELPLAVAGLDFTQLDAVKNSLGEAVARQQEVLQQLPTLVETGILDPETAKLRAYKVQTEISVLQGKLATLPPVNLRSVAQAVSLPQFWLDLSESERRFYFREFIQQIEIRRQGEEWELQVVLIF
jgi:DNA invertase Pin-like site-specific DNA recombinase